MVDGNTPLRLTDQHASNVAKARAQIAGLIRESRIPAGYTLGEFAEAMEAEADRWRAFSRGEVPNG